MKKLVSLLTVCALSASMAMGVSAYTDMENSAYSGAVEELSEYDIISGFDDDTFRPTEYVTRAQAAKMFAVALGFSEEKYKSMARAMDFSDFKLDHWAYKYADYIMWEIDILGARTNSILSGFEDGTFRPDENVTIIQLAKMAICCFNDYLEEQGYQWEAAENGDYPDGYNFVAQKYGFFNGVTYDDINETATREQAAQIISNTINMPIKEEVLLTTITDDHKWDTINLSVTCDGSNANYPLYTLKTMLISNDWGNQNPYSEISPLENTEEFYSDTEIESISPDVIVLKPGLLINTDGSFYSQEEPFEAVNNGFELDINRNYYMQFKKQDGAWHLVNYALFE